MYYFSPSTKFQYIVNIAGRLEGEIEGKGISVYVYIGKMPQLETGDKKDTNPEISQ